MTDYKIVIIGKVNNNWSISTFLVPTHGFTNGNCLEYELAKAIVNITIDSHGVVRYFPIAADKSYCEWNPQYMFDEGLSFYELVEDYING